MSTTDVRMSQTRRAAGLALVFVALMGIALGWWSAHQGTTGVPVAYAYKGANFNCPGGDTTKTSALTVTHRTPEVHEGSSRVVEPDTGETWAITAWWEAGGPPWGQTSQTAYATVDWNGSAWVLSNVQLTQAIVGIGICQVDTCTDSESNTHSWNYKLVVDVKDPEPVTTYNLREVVYVTTSVDDGYTVEDPTHTHGYCWLDAAVSPTSQTFTAYDNPAVWDSNRCPYTCYTAGASVTITYE
jgi:hypothetical protein